MRRYEDVELAACALIGADQNSEEVEGNYTVCDTLGKLRAGMKSFMSAERLKVYEEDVNLLLISLNYSQVQESTRCRFRWSTETGIYKCILRNSPKQSSWAEAFYRPTIEMYSHRFVRHWGR